MSLYCKCGEKIERTKPNIKLSHRGEDCCEKCAGAGLHERYNHLVSKRTEGTQKWNLLRKRNLFP